MSNPQNLIRMLKDLEDQLIVCMRCGMCQSVCPLFDQTGREADVARGKLALLDGLSKKLLDDAAGVSERLNRCLLCGSCAANCPSGVNVLEIFIKARAILAGYMGLSPAKKLIFRGMLAHPDFFNQLTEMGAKFQKIFTKPINDLLGTSCARVAAPLLGGRHIKDLAPVPFHRIQPSLDTDPGASGIRVAFYVGCLLDKIYPQIAEAVIKVLGHHEVGVFMPPNQACCGIPAVSSGDLQTFGSLVSHNLALFDPDQFDYLVTACATCTSTIKKIWPVMHRSGSPDSRGKLTALCEKTMDINAFIVSKLDIAGPSADTLDEKTIVTYHDPCHLKKSLGVSDEPRRLVTANPRYILKEMKEPDSCCGMGGSFNIMHYDLSASIGKRKQDNISRTGSSVLTTGCPACMTQLSDMLSQAGKRIAIKHPVEIYSEMIKDTVS